MKQTVVGVFETSEEARRAQAALLDAQFPESSVRVSAGGTLRGVDEGMAYPVGSVRGLDDSASLESSGMVDPSDPLRPTDRVMRVQRRDHAPENALERVTEFFKGLFSSESQREELSRYEEALRRGGALVAIDVEDEVEQTLASDILIRAGAYDLEERVSQWNMPAMTEEASLDPVPGSVKTQPIRSAAMPGNVTSMDPSDATGYRASRTDFATGETWPATRTAMGAGRTATATSRDSMHDPVHHEDLTRAPAGAGMASWDRLQGDFGVEGDYGAEQGRGAGRGPVRTEYLQGQTMSDKSTPADWHQGPDDHAWLEGHEGYERRAMGTQAMGGQSMRGQSMSGQAMHDQSADSRVPSYPADVRDRVESAPQTSMQHASMQQSQWQGRQTQAATRSMAGESSRRPAMQGDMMHDGPTSGSFGEERVQPQSSSQSSSSRDAMRAQSSDMSSAPSHMRNGTAEDLDAPIIRSRDLDRPPMPSSERMAPQSVRPHMAMSDRSMEGVGSMSDEGDMGNEVVSSDEARHLLASGCEVFLDDCGFARMRNGGRVQPIQRDEPTKIARNVRVYSRRADDPVALREARMRDDSFSHESSMADESGERTMQAGSTTVTGMSQHAAARNDDVMAARDRRMMRASLRARDCDDAREVDPFMSSDDAMSGVEAGVRDASFAPDPASGDWAADWEAQTREAQTREAQGRASWDDMSSPGPDELEADRLGDDAAGRSAAAMAGRPWPAPGRRPTGADELARREAALREATLSDYGERLQQRSHPEWRDSAAGDPRERAAELARREATLRDQTLQDYAAMDERAEMRAANAAAAARASHASHAPMSGEGRGDLYPDVQRADVPPTVRSSPSSMTKDMSAELGLHSPLEDRFGARRTALDDGAPLGDAYDDDDRRYSAQDDAYPTDESFVDTRDPRHRATRTPSEWNHMKEAVRNAWHKMTHPGRHH